MYSLIFRSYASKAMEFKNKWSMVIINRNTKDTGVLSVNVELAMKGSNHGVYTRL